ncbi:MAG: arginyltransferase [Mariniblastus sp.]|nr:arginyltransferase [Mariniblastus sp.]
MKDTGIVILDEVEDCPYLEGESARMPLRMPLTKLTPEEIDQLLSDGNRRTGEFIYQTKCANCQSCEPIRIDLRNYKFSRNQRRQLNRGDGKFTQRFGPLECDASRLDLFNKHRRLRGLAKNDLDVDAEEYKWGFVQSCFDSFEITYWLEEQLVCLAVCDLGRTSLSAVYTFFDPDFQADGLGTYSILKQIELCQQRSLDHLYLGYYIADSPHMNYKSRFLPNQRLIDGRWTTFTSR